MKIALSIITIFNLSLLCAQSPELENISFPVSPTAQSFMTFKEFASPGATGKIPISVPLYTMNDNQIGVDIALSYQSGGIKVSEISGVAGLGWSIGIGGAITRSVRGRPDEGVNGYFTMGYKIDSLGGTDTQIMNYLNQVVDGQIDSEPDIFSFYYPGGGGTFMYNYDGSILTIPHQDIVISGSPEVGFTLKTNQGITYHYTNIEKTRKEGSTCGYSGTDPSLNSFNSAWFLDKIESAYCNEISFSYDSSDYNYEWTPNEIWLINGIQKSSCTSQSLSESKYVTSIQSAKEKVEFIYSTTTRNDVPGAPRLDQMKVTNVHNDEVIKWYQFTYLEVENTAGSTYYNTNYNWSNTTGHGYRLFLDSIDQISIDGQETLPYRSFEYNPTPLPSRTSTGRDQWGYYNGENSNPSYIAETSIFYKGINIPPLNTDQIRVLGDANQHVDTTGAFTSAGILTKMIYPTGGFTEFAYEPNTFNRFSSDFSVRKRYELQQYLCGAQKCNIQEVNLVLAADSAFNSVTSYFSLNIEQRINLEAFIAGDHCGTNIIRLYNDDTDAIIFTVYGESSNVNVTSGWDLDAGNYRLEIVGCDFSENSPIILGSMKINYLFLEGSANTREFTGGLRIESVRNCANSADCQVKKYEYENEGVSNGQLLYNTNTLQYDVEHSCNTLWEGDTSIPDSVLNSMSWDVFFTWVNQQITNTDSTLLLCDPAWETSYFITDAKVYSTPQNYNWGQSHITYRKISIKELDGESNLNGHTEHYFSTLFQMFDYMSLAGNNYNNLNDLFFEFKDTFRPLSSYREKLLISELDQVYKTYDEYFFSGLISPNKFWITGKPERIEVYNSAGDLIQSSTNIYQISFGSHQKFRVNNNTNFLSSVKGMKVIRNSSYVENGIPYGYNIARYNIPSAWMDREKVIKKQFEPSGELLSETTFEFDSVYHLLTSTTTTNSKGEEIITKNLYAKDYDTSLPAISTLMSSNQHAKPISSTQFLNNKVIGSNVTSYKVAGTVAPDKSYSLTEANPIANFTQNVNGNGKLTSLLPSYNYTEQIEYSAYYACGIPREYKTKDGIYNTIVWDLTDNLVLAKVTNARVGQVAYHNFDQSPRGAWTLTQPTVTGGHSGIYCMNSDISRDYLEGGNYTVGIWAKGTGQIKAGNGSFKTVTNDWEYYEWSVSHSAGNFDIEVSSSTVRYDDVQIKPVNSSMSAYTYNDQRQVVQEVNAQNAVRYQYDNFSRLISIRDQENNLLKKIDYMYQNSPSN